MSKTKWNSKVIHLVVALLVVALTLNSSPVPVLASPVVDSVTETAFGTDTTAHNVYMPATVDADDLLIVLFTNDGSATVTTPNGWTTLASTANGKHVRLSVYYKIAAGTEGGTTVNFVTSASEQAAAQVYRITDWHGTTPPEISAVAVGKSTPPDPASLNPAGWGVADTLWIAVAGQDRGNKAGTTTYPAGYTDGISTLSNPKGRDQCRTLSARRALVAASENPGAFTIPVAEEWVAFTIAVRPVPVQYDLTTSSTGGGSVTTPGEDTFTYDEGTEVDLVAVADEGYRFDEWTGNVSTIADANAAATNITMEGDYSITANFAKYEYTLTTNASPPEGGTVTGGGSYDCCTNVTVEAIPADACWHFTGWSGDLSGTENPTTIHIDGDKTVTANFAKYEYTLTTNASPPEGGTVTGGGSYDCCTNVTLTASPSEGYSFTYWSGDLSGSASPTSIHMDSDKTVTAHFVATPKATRLELLPEEGENPVDTTHNLTATVYDQFNNVMEGVAVTWNITGVGSFSGSPESPTDVDGEADAVITSSVPGTSTVTCEVTGNPSVSDTATKDWTLETPVPTTLELLPGTGTNPVGTTHQLTATVKDQFGYEMEGVAVTWTIESGPGSFVSQDTTTDGNGEADAVITSSEPGMSTVTCEVTGHPSVSDTATKEWTEEVPLPQEDPTVSTQAATDITTNSTILNMSYTVGDYAVDVRFAYKKSADSAWSYTDWVSKTADGSHDETPTGLESDTEYDFKAQLKYDTTEIEGDELQFTTAAPSGCFIATAAYGTPTAEQIDVLREFRDVVLLESTAGSQFVALYYQLSPPVADFIAGNELLRTVVRKFLVDPIVWVVEATGTIWRN